GECINVDKTKKEYQLLVYKVVEPDFSSIWKIHVEPGDVKITIPFDCPRVPVSFGTKKPRKKKGQQKSDMNTIKKRKGGVIPTETIFAITDDSRFEWAPNWTRVIKDSFQ